MAALDMFPEKKVRIETVQREGSFELVDISWISDTIGQTLRVSIKQESYSRVMEHCPDIPVDMVFGQGPVSVHMLFSWQLSSCGSNVFGHFDLLVPSAPAQADMALVPDVARFDKLCPYILYIYICTSFFIYIYIYL